MATVRSQFYSINVDRSLRPSTSTNGNHSSKSDKLVALKCWYQIKPHSIPISSLLSLFNLKKSTLIMTIVSLLMSSFADRNVYSSSFSHLSPFVLLTFSQIRRNLILPPLPFQLLCMHPILLQKIQPGLWSMDPPRIGVKVVTVRDRKRSLELKNRKHSISSWSGTIPRR